MRVSDGRSRPKSGHCGSRPASSAVGRITDIARAACNAFPMAEVAILKNHFANIRSASPRLPDNLKYLMSASKPFELRLAPQCKAQIASIRSEVVKRRRDQDLPALGEGGEPRRENHGLSEVVGRLVDRLADMQAHADPDWQFRVGPAIGREQTLRRDRAQGPLRALEKATMKLSPSAFTSTPRCAAICWRKISLWTRMTS
jgi:hypothetical protein